MGIRIWIVALAALLSGRNAAAQINESDTLHYQLRVLLNGNYQQGNVELLAVRSKVDFLWAPQTNWVFKSQNSSLYQTIYGRKADNDVFSRNYLYFQPHRRIYPFVIAYLSGNFRRKIESRYFVGTGISWQVVNTRPLVLKCSASVVKESTRFGNSMYNYPEYDGRDKLTLWRGTLYTGGWAYLLHRQLRVFYDVFWQPAFSEPRNYRSQYDLGLDLFVWKGLSFNVLYTSTHENVVVQNVKQNDRNLSFGLAYNFRKKAGGSK